jgi:hypothetical protein
MNANKRESGIKEGLEIIRAAQEVPSVNACIGEKYH